MGLNLQSDEFWELRPDNFYRMSRAYDIRQQEVWLPFRRLMTVIAGSQGVESKDSDFIFLDKFDKKVTVKPIKLTDEQIKQAQEDFKKYGSRT